jgi:hypothetical protein
MILLPRCCALCDLQARAVKNKRMMLTTARANATLMSATLDLLCGWLGLSVQPGVVVEMGELAGDVKVCVSVKWVVIGDWEWSVVKICVWVAVVTEAETDNTVVIELETIVMVDGGVVLSHVGLGITILDSSNVVVGVGREEKDAAIA